MKNIRILLLLFLFSCQKDEIIIEPELIEAGTCPSKIPNNKVFKFYILDNLTVDYYVVEIIPGAFNPTEKFIKLGAKKMTGEQLYECEVEMKSNFYTVKIQVVYNKKVSKYLDKQFAIFR